MNAAALPDWPRILRAELAAAYCGVSEGTFRTMVKDGLYPNPVIKRGGIVAWDKAQIDKFIDRMASGDAMSKDTDAEIDDWFKENA